MTLLKYSLWLMPADTVYRKLSQLISQLAEHHSSPDFPPHVTLIGSIEGHEQDIITKAQEVASLVHPYIIKLTSIDYTNDYYRSLFVRVEPSADVLSAHQKAKMIFSSHQEPNYMPHLSLLYGDFSVEIKKQIIKKIGNSFTDEFEANTLYLYLTEGVVGDWQRVRAFSLQ